MDEKVIEAAMYRANEKLKSVFNVIKRKEEEMVQQKMYEQALTELSSLPDGWDSYDAPRPNEKAINTAKDVLNCLLRNKLLPTKIMPSVEGGIYFLFTKANKYADLECDNDGDLIAGMSDRIMIPITWHVHFGYNREHNIGVSIKIILSFLNSNFDV